MTQIVELDFTVLAVNSITGEPIPNVDMGGILDALFDSVPTKSNKNYSLYNGILMDIRKARMKNAKTIEIDKTELETMKSILISASLENPEINRKVGFVVETIEKVLTAPIPEPKTVESSIVET